MIRRTIQGKSHDLILLIVTDRYENGRPKQATIVYDEDRVQLEDGMEFITCWAPSEVIEKKS